MTPAITNDIRTEYVHPPIPQRNFDWQACIDGREEEGPTGNGTTEAEAIQDLLSAMWEEELI